MPESCFLSLRKASYARLSLSNPRVFTFSAAASPVIASNAFLYILTLKPFTSSRACEVYLESVRKNLFPAVRRMYALDPVKPER
ncbi:MAG: hypothetical protein Q8P48_03330 [Deltaproteobacteria bacterium]|nr:hypothetical protein [Deltaproteobacteria bacterium]